MNPKTMLRADAWSSIGRQRYQFINSWATYPEARLHSSSGEGIIFSKNDIKDLLERIEEVEKGYSNSANLDMDNP